MIKRILTAVLVVYSTGSYSTEIGNGTDCKMPVAAFNLSYMSSVLKNTFVPGAKNFLQASSNELDSSKMQFFLWHVYLNPMLAHDFFSRVAVEELVARNEDSINAILWLMLQKGGYFDEDGGIKGVRLSLSTWKADFKVRDPQRSWLLDVYLTEQIAEERPTKQAGTIDDVDVELRLGVAAEKQGKLLEALYFYTRAAQSGSQQGLVGASLILPRVGGQECVSRAAYYALLSGATGPVQWFPRMPSRSLH